MKTPDPSVLDITEEAFQEWQVRVKQNMGSADSAILDALVQAYLFIKTALSAARVSLVRLKRVFGILGTEKSRNIFPDPEALDQKNGGAGKSDINEEDGKMEGKGKSGESNVGREDGQKEGKSTRKGHGRNGVDAYTGAEKVPVPYEGFYKGCPCPEEDCNGKVYIQEPGKVLRITGQAPLKATVYAPERWRCGLCDKVFTAPLPSEAGEDKYHVSAVAMIAILHFANGFAFHRLEQYQKSLGIPLPASQQSALLTKAYQDLLPLLKDLIRSAAQCDVIHNDDTGMKVLALLALIKKSEEDSSSKAKKKKRTGIHTTGIVALTAAYQIALYFTGRKHAGENLADVLQHRDPSLPPPIHMSDGLDHNAPGKLGVKSSKCLTHGRRQFVDIVTSFPEECRRVVEVLGDVYHVDAIAKKRKLSPVERLFLHQEKSAPLMDGLRRWMTDQLLGDTVEPNSGLGRAMKYMLKRWEQLTLFLRAPGAPLDNTVVERALKKAIRHRKNSLFYKTERGAAVGDLFMSLIETCSLNRVNAFEYLSAVLENIHRVQKNPGAWMPWNYRTALHESAAMTQAEGTRKDSPNLACGPPPLQSSAEIGTIQAGKSCHGASGVAKNSEHGRYTKEATGCVPVPT